jgi:STELLO glycosyltransferases
MLHSVITTIQRPTNSVRKLALRLADGKGKLVIAGDTKGPDYFELSDVEGFANDQLTFLSIDDQLNNEFHLAQLLPTKHYSRKNIGYLHAIKNGATCIYETDDDNAPLDSWQPRSEYIDSTTVLKSSNEDAPNWVNVYRHFSQENIWPRGLPLDRIHARSAATADYSPAMNDGGQIWAPIQQGLADGAPDVDAIWRLVLDREFLFDNAESALLPPGQWCPFNTQSTWWWPAVYPLLYVPSYCSFRMCDIWKSFIAQRCLWELGTGVVFHAPEVWQERNVHDLMRDFNDEVPGYQQNHRIAEVLTTVELRPGVNHVSRNLLSCYRALVSEQVFPESEMPLLQSWIRDLEAVD